MTWPIRKNADPVLRESTRLTCAGSIAGQFSYDVLRWPEILGEDAAKRFSEARKRSASMD